MPMVSFALSEEMKDELSARAGGAGVSAYLRACLAETWGREDRNNALLSALNALTARLNRGATETGTASRGSHEIDGALLEILLLLRAIAGPDKLRGAQAEVERVGLTVWGSSIFSKR